MGISTVGGSTTTTQDKTVVYGNPGTYTFTPPAGTSSTNPLLCEVTVIGGGGGGGNFNSNGTSGQGGGAAQVVKQSRAYVTGPTTVTVGAGGAAETAGGTSSFAGISALGGYGGTASTSATSKRTGMDDTTKGAAGKSAVNVMYTVQSATSNIKFKSVGDFATNGNLTQELSPPPFSSPSGYATASLAGSVYVYCVPYVSGTSGGYSGGNNTAFYNNGSWTIRATQAIPNSNYFTFSIGTTALCFPGSSAGSYNVYYYATAGQTSWTTAYLPISGGGSQPWYFDITKDGNEIFAGNYGYSTIAKTNDGINWTTYSVPSAPYTQSGAGWIQWLHGEQYYIYHPNGSIGHGGTCYTSPNLSTWTTRSLSTSIYNNAGVGGGGLIGLGTGASYVFWRGDNSTSSYANTWYSSNGYAWNSLGWINDNRQGPQSAAAPIWYTSKNNFIVQGCNAYSGNSYRALYYGTGWFPTSEWYSGANESTGAVSLVSLPGQPNAAPSTFPGITDLEPTGGSSGVPSNSGDGGDGGGYTAPIAKTTATGAAPTAGQVPGAGGGGGGAGSTTGAAGAAGLVSIKYYG